jgi:tetratricopeptide (TPR) repeat protein
VDAQELSRSHPKKAVQDYEKAIEEIRKENTEKALPLLKSVLDLAPDYYAAHNTLGTVYQKMNRYRDAEDAYKRAVALRPKLDEPLVNLGALYIQEAARLTGEGSATSTAILRDARDALKEALNLNRSAMAHYLLGTAYFRSAAYDDAESNLRQALALEPRMASARLMLANLYIRLQNWQNALLNLDMYLSENPKAPDRVQVQETRAKVAQRIQ